MAVKLLKHHQETSLKLLKKYQTGELKLIKTNRPWLDAPGGILPQSIITILGASFSGKTTELESLKQDIMNVEINEDAKDYVSLSHLFEMTNFSLTLKDIKKQTGKKFKDIIGEEFNEEEKSKLQSHFKVSSDERFYVNHDTGTPEEIAKQTEDFLKENINKKLCLVSLDHTLLLKAKQNNKKGAIDDMLELLNDFKHIYPNMVLILLSQANRSVLSRISPKSNDMKLRRDDISTSDSLFHISDSIYGLQNAWYLGVELYRKIRPAKYEHLSHRFDDKDSSGKVSLHSEGCIFVEILKDRMADDLDFIDLYTIEIKPFEKETNPKSTSTSAMPIFKPEVIEPVPANFDLNEAFGPPVEDDGQDVPF